MDLGQWMRSLRKEQKLDIRTLSERTGVEVSTISRVETAQTQVTLIIAIRLCEGLGVNAVDVLTAVRGKRPFAGDREPMRGVEAVPTMDDVEQFLTYFHRNKEGGKVWLSDLLNRVVVMGKNTEGDPEGEVSQFIVPADIHKLLFDSPVYRFEIQYPSAITASGILAIYQHGAMLTPMEIREYIKKVRREKQVTIARLEQAAKLSPSVLSRLESAEIEQIKLADVLVLDEQLGQEGTLLLMYWSVYSFYERLVRRDATSAEQDMKLASIFITTCRWLQFMNPQDVSWISNVRSYEKMV
jgi:transcriptional regulator with XRE-family HTH domain